MKRIQIEKLTKLVSILNLLPSTVKGLRAVEALAKVNVAVGGVHHSTVDLKVPDDGPWSEDGIGVANELMEKAQVLCVELELRATLKQVERIQRLLKLPVVSMRDLANSYEQLVDRINDELESVVVLKIDPGKERLYEAHDLFGLEVATAFPSASYDVQEAGSCFSCGRWTACVFHLMRALEVPLGQLAKILGIGFTSGNWNKLLNDFDEAFAKALKDNSSVKGADWKHNEEFYSGASALLRNVKNAWRNSVSHRVESYDEDRARSVLNSVESIMKHLATRLNESQST